MTRLLLMLLVTMATFGCGGPRYVDFFPYHDDGTPKPKIVVLPMSETPDCQFPWDVPQELLQGIYGQVMDRGELYVYSQQEVSAKLAQIQPIDFFESDQMLARQYCGADFIVLTELMEYRYVPSKENCFTNCYLIPYTLHVKVRLRIIDIRSQCPTVVLQEILEQSSAICRRFDPRDKAPDFSSEDYQSSSVGRVHEDVIYRLSNRLEEVIRRVY